MNNGGQVLNTSAFFYQTEEILSKYNSTIIVLPSVLSKVKMSFENLQKNAFLNLSILYEGFLTVFICQSPLYRVRGVRT